MINFIDEKGVKHSAIVECKKTKGVNGEKSLSGTIYTNEKILEGIGRGWRLEFENEKYCLTYVYPIDEGNQIVVEFDAVHEFFFDLNKKVVYSELNGSNTAKAYLDLIFNGSGYSYLIEVNIPAFEKESFGMRNRLDLFKEFISDTGVEFSVSGKVVRILEKVGSNLSTIVKKGFNLNELRIEKDPGSFITYKKGFGAWHDDDDHSKGRLEVEYLSPLASIYGKLEGDPIVDERYKVASNFETRLKNDVESSYGISVDIDMEDLTKAGYEYEQPHEGDYIMAINKDLAFEQKIRIMSYETSYDTNGNIIDHKVSCGSDNIIRKSIKEDDEFRKEIQAGLEGAISTSNKAWISANGKNAVFEGPEEPTPTAIGDIWYQIDGEEKIMRIWNGYEWKPVFNPGEIENKIDQAEKDIAQNIIDIESALDKATQAELDAGSSKDLAGEAKALGVTASSLAGEATTNANKAMTDAQDAIRQVVLNGRVAADASAEATEARRLASLAEGNSQEALTKANTSVTDASKALTDATKAFNKSFKSSAVAYATSTNGSTPPTTGWVSTNPTPSPDVYIWTRTTIVLNDNTSVVSYSVGKIGVKGDQGLKGDTGGQGIQGVPGVNAPTITSVVQQFYLSTSTTTQTGGSWLSTVPVWSSGRYYWVRVVTTYSNGTSTTSTPVLDNALNDSLVTALEVKTANQNLSTTVTQHATLIEGKANSTTVDAIAGRVTTAEGSISTIAGQVELKANSTDVQTLTGRVTTAEGKITTQAGQIALKANTTTVSALTGRVTTAEGNITTQAGQIALKANQSVVDTLTGRVTATEASIKVTDGKVTTLTTKTDGNTTSIGQLQTGYDGLRSTVTNVDWMARTNGALQLTPDPTFLTSSNRLNLYNNSSNANVAVKRVQLEEGQPTGSPYIISIATTGSPTSPGLGGVVYVQNSRANAIFMIKFTAKIPTGYTVYHAMNSVGIGAKVTWVTSREGTGTWTEYAYVTECGSSGSFSNFGHIYLATGVAPVTWYIAKYELFDISKSQQQAFSDLQQDINGFKTTVANTYADKTTVTQLATSIDLKATKTDVDALTGRVSTAEGKITTQAGQIALKANTSTVNTLTGRVTTAEGNITTQAGLIALKANQSTVDTLTGRVSTTEAKITATDGKVTTLTTKTDGNTASIGTLQTSYTGLSSTVSEVELGLQNMGGVNLIPNTDGVWETTSISSGSAYGVWRNDAKLTSIFETMVLKPHIASFDVFIVNSVNSTANVRIYGANRTPKYSLKNALIRDVPTNKWVRVSTPIEIVQTTNSGNSLIEFYGESNINTTKIMVDKIQFEKGSIPTPWSPAPEDMATVTQFSSLEQTVKGLQTTVGNKAEQSQVTQLAGQWSATVAKVDGHTTQITSMGTQINLRATKTEVAESILADKTIKDTRTTNQLPPWYYTNYPKQKAYEFKQCSTIGLPTSAGTYASVVTEVPWTGSSGGTIEQTATATDGVYQRRGTTTWSAWAKVADSSNIISQINISPESILIASAKIQIKGDTYIDNGVIKTAHIADLAVSGAKIANASISSAKIISLDASKINVGTLTGHTLNGGTIVGGTITGTSFFNSGADGDMSIANGRVRAKDFFVEAEGSLTSLTSYVVVRSNESVVYLQSNEEVRATKVRSVTDYTNFRANRVIAQHSMYSYGNYEAATNTYLQANNGWVGVRSLNDNVWLMGSSVKVQNANNTSWVNIYANAFIGEGGNTSFGTSSGYTVVRSSGDTQPVYLQGNEIRATKVSSAGSYVAVRASAFPTGSLEEYKTNIRKRQSSALSIIRNSDIYEYNLKSELESGKSKTRIGLVIGDGYNTPSEIIDGDGVEQYAMSSLAWQAIQELDVKVNETTQTNRHEVFKLRSEIQNLKHELNELKHEVEMLRQSA